MNVCFVFLFVLVDRITDHKQELAHGHAGICDCVDIFLWTVTIKHYVIYSKFYTHTTGIPYGADDLIRFWYFVFCFCCLNLTTDKTKNVVYAVTDISVVCHLSQLPCATAITLHIKIQLGKTLWTKFHWFFWHASTVPPKVLEKQGHLDSFLFQLSFPSICI